MIGYTRDGTLQYQYQTYSSSYYIIYVLLTSHLFILQYHTVEIQKTFITSPHIIFKTKVPNTSKIKSIYPLYDDNRILVESKGRIMRMWDMNLVRNQAVTMDTQHNANMQKFISVVSCSRKIVATESQVFTNLWDTITWEVVRYIDYESCMRIAFLPNEIQIAVLSGSFVILWNTNNTENCLSFYLQSTRKHVLDWKITFQISNHVVICVELQKNNHVFVFLVQVQHMTDLTCLFFFGHQDSKILRNISSIQYFF